MSDKHNVLPVVLSGGQGTRLWPLSRANMPKQFIPMLFGQSLFQQTIDRIYSGNNFRKPIVMCAHNHRYIVDDLKNAHQWQFDHLIVEPCGRNTAAALAIAALQAIQSGDNPILLMLPSDHYIPDNREFLNTVEQGLPLAESGYIVTFGIKPHSPHTGYGYIEQGDVISQGYRVAKFHEKPDAVTAKGYLDAGGFCWNSGIYMTKASVYLDELKNNASDVYSFCFEAYQCARRDEGSTALVTESFERVPSLSIDVAVMEKTDKGVMVPASFRWDDLGSWDALWSMSSRDASANAIHGDVVAVNTQNSLLWTSGPLLCTVGIENIIAVAEEDVVFIGARNHAEEIRDLVETLKLRGRAELVGRVRSINKFRCSPPS